MILWKVFYDDGSTFTNDDGTPEDVPTMGVIAVTQTDGRHGRLVARNSDYYIYDESLHVWWEGVDLFGLWDYLSRPGWKRVLFGRTIHSDLYFKIMHEAFNDTDLPPKSAWDGVREQRDDRLWAPT